jgi:hypothetical protein
MTSDRVAIIGEGAGSFELETEELGPVHLETEHDAIAAEDGAEGRDFSQPG